MITQLLGRYEKFSRDFKINMIIGNAHKLVKRNNVKK